VYGITATLIHVWHAGADAVYGGGGGGGGGFSFRPRLLGGGSGLGEGREEGRTRMTRTQQRARFPPCRARRRARNKRGREAESRTNSVGRPAGGVWCCGMGRLGGSEVCLGRVQTGPSISVYVVGSHGLGRQIQAAFEGRLLPRSVEAAALSGPLGNESSTNCRMNGHVHTSVSAGSQSHNRITIIILMR
jgi:hypothetical protein